MLDIEVVKNHIKYLREDQYSREFYVALLMYDVLGLKEDAVTEEIVSDVFAIQDNYDSLYKEELREELRDLELEKEQEEEGKQEEAEREEEGLEK